MNHTNLKEILADLYKKRAALSQELDIMAQDPKEKKTKRYNKHIDSYDKLTKRIIDLEESLGGDRDDSEEINRMRDLFSLVEWSHKHAEQQKKQLMTIKHNPPGDKRITIVEKGPPDPETELEYLLEKRRRMTMVTNDKLHSPKSKIKRSVQKLKRSN